MISELEHSVSELFWQCWHDFVTALCGSIFLHDFWTVLTVWYFSTWFLELFWQCGMFRHDFWTLLHDFGTVLTVWYFSTWFGNCSDSVFFLHVSFTRKVNCYVCFGSILLWQCIFPSWFLNCSDSVFTWFLNCSDSVVFPTWFLNCSHSVVFPTSFRSYSDSVVFFYMISELFWQCSISYIVSELFWQCCVFLHDFVTALTMLYFSTCLFQ